jgi:protein TonB
MFGEFVEARAGEAGRKRWAIAVSALCQAGTLLVLLLAPLLYTDALPNPLSSIKALFVPAMPLVEAPKPQPEPVQIVKQGHRFTKDRVIYQPKGFPPKPLIFEEAPLPPELPAGAMGPGLLGTELFNDLAAGRSEVEPPRVVPAPIQRIRQSEIQPAMILSQPQPAYPPLARNVKIQGDVILHAIIDREGRVAELEVVSGHPMLARAALDAVRMWRYQPTLLNGEPVEVETTIKVSFVLGR